MVTERLQLVPATIALCDAEVRGAAFVARTLGATVPESWPPPVFEPSRADRNCRLYRATDARRDRRNRLCDRAAASAPRIRDRSGRRALGPRVGGCQRARGCRNYVRSPSSINQGASQNQDSSKRRTRPPRVSCGLSVGGPRRLVLLPNESVKLPNNRSRGDAGVERLTRALGGSVNGNPVAEG